MFNSAGEEPKVGRTWPHKRERWQLVSCYRLAAQSSRLRLRLVVGFAFLLTLGSPAAAGQHSPTAIALTTKTTTQAPSRVLHRVVLIGDTGGFDPESQEPLLEVLTRFLSQTPDSVTVVFLGDNVYPRGLPDSAAAGREFAEARLIQQLDAVKGTGARVIVTPGNHDWDNSGPDGLAAIRRQEIFVESYLDQGNTFLPDNGLPGPESVELAPGVEMIVIDTEWWIRDQEKGFGDAGRYETEEEGDLLLNIADILRRKDGGHVMVVGHHPIKSNGKHGGHFPLHDHIFPLTALWDWAYVPLPVIGSLYPLAVAWIGGKQDLAHWKYRALSESLTGLFDIFPNNLIYASGHEHSLQHFKSGNVDFLVSGSSSRPEYVSQGHGAAFASNEPGFLEVAYLADGSVSLTAHTAGGTIYDTQLHPPSSSSGGLPSPPATEPMLDSDSLVVVAAEPRLGAGLLKRAFLGSANRDAWTTPVGVSILDASTAYGGLTAVRRGGGQQTVSVRLESEDGSQYVLRSLTKDPTKTLPLEIQETFARDIALDQVSVLHPYGALLVPPLAQAAGIYHAIPQAVFVPYDRRLAPYEDLVANRVMLLEQRPDADMSKFPNFGSSTKVIGARKMYSEITADNDHRVDQRFFARSRLLDMLISDWDRHEDQWRWATFEPPDGKGKIYRPIPRDRDWAFNKMDGFFPNILQSRLLLPKFQEFKEDYGFVLGLNQNGFPQDRRLTSALTSADWLEIADSVAEAITDSVIEVALSRWPQAIQDLQAAEFRRILRARRAGLHQAAASYTKYLDRFVDVVMSNKHEEFVVSGTPDGMTEVVVYKTTKDGERQRELFRRFFDPERTREVRLYGMGGNDQFHVPESGPSVRVEIIGGTGQDAFRGSPNTSSFVSIYDTESGITIQEPGRARIRTSDNPRVNDYERSEFRFNAVLPAVLIGANEDDGLFLGGGASFYRHSFRRHPFAAKHRIRANSAIRIGAFNAFYDGQFIDVLLGLDVVLEASVRSPNNVRNFFGLGNESINDGGTRSFYQAEFSQYSLELGLRRRITPSSHVSVASVANLIDVRLDQARFVAQSGISPDSFNDQAHGGLQGTFVFDARDSPILPARGMRWTSSVSGLIGLNGSSQSYAVLRSSASAYLSGTNFAGSTLAFRAGIEHVIGNFPFFAAATLGGSRNLRGWRNARFAGRTAVYQNLELRSRIGRFAGFLANGQIGLLGFVDQGRVWTDGESSGTWHRGAGGGAWVSLFDSMVLSGSVGFSKEQSHFVLSTGFLF